MGTLAPAVNGWRVPESHLPFLFGNGSTQFAYGIVVTLISSFLFPLHVRKPLETQVLNHLPSGKGYMSGARARVRVGCVDFQAQGVGA